MLSIFVDNNGLLSSYCEALEQFQDTECLALTVALANLAKLYAAQGKYTDCLAQYKIVLGVQSRLLPGSHRFIAQTLKEMGHTCESLHRYKEALGHYDAALRMERKLLDTEVHIEVAELHHRLGHVYTLELDYDNALMFYEKALVVRRILYGNEHSEVVSTLNLMGNLQKYRGQYDMALELHNEVLVLRRKLFGEDSPAVQTTIEIIGKIRRISDVKEEAEVLISNYIRQRTNETKVLGVGFSKDEKVNASYFLLQIIKDSGVEQFNCFDRVVGYSKHKDAIEDGRLGKIVEKIRMDAFTNFK